MYVDTVKFSYKKYAISFTILPPLSLVNDRQSPPGPGGKEKNFYATPTIQFRTSVIILDAMFVHENKDKVKLPLLMDAVPWNHLGSVKMCSRRSRLRNLMMLNS
jgi:hypothetical protein